MFPSLNFPLILGIDSIRLNDGLLQILIDNTLYHFLFEHTTLPIRAKVDVVITPGNQSTVRFIPLLVI